MIEIYKKYREKQMVLHSKILKSAVSRERLLKAASTMGILKKDQVVMEKEEEGDLFFDFNVYEKIEDNKNAVGIYIENNAVEDKIELELLEAMKNTNTSLYKIKSIDKEKHTLYLEDMLNGGEDISIIDIGFSESASCDMLLFLRIIKLQKFNFTSGVAMVFSGNHLEYLLRRSKKFAKKLEIEDESLKRFISYFYLHRTDGLETIFEKV